MKNSKLVNVVLVVIIGLSMLFVARESLAADTTTKDLTNTLTGNNTANNSNIQTISGSSTKNNTVNNSTDNVLTTNNTSTYNNTLPKTGAGDVVPGIVLVVVLGISAVYAYNKIQYYKNI